MSFFQTQTVSNMRICTRIVFVLLLALLNAAASFAQTDAGGTPTAYTDVSYFVVAHQDDWQLFMGTNAGNDIISGEKVVIIYVTAGDLDGAQAPYGVDLCTHDPNPYVNRTVPYYIIREVGATYSLHLMAENSAMGWCFEPYPTVTNPVINGHPVRRYEYRNTVSYFMRVIDNDLNHMGWDHSVSGNTIDGSTSYANWCDLTLTMARILLMERVSPGNTGWLNIPEVESSLNPGDHTSHIFAGKAALCAVNYHLGQNYPTALFVGYDTQNRPPNLGVVDAANEAGMSAAYNISLINHRIWNEWRGAGNLFQEWCARNYYRVSGSQDVRFEYCGCEREEIDVRRSSSNETPSGSIYPNPASSVLNINIEEETDNNSKVLVFNAQGKLVFEQPCQQKTPVRVNVSNFIQGNYFVHITTKSGTVIHKTAVLRE